MTYRFSLRLLPLIVGVSWLWGCASAPTAPPAPPESPYVEKLRAILRLEDARILGDLPAQPDPAPPAQTRGRRPAAAPRPPVRLDLVSLLKDAEPRVRRRAALGIGRVGLPEGVEPLKALLATDTVPEVRHMAAFALGLIGDAAAADALTTALGDPDALVQGRAAEALGQIAHKPAAAAVGAMIKTHITAGALTGIEADDQGYPKSGATEAVRLGLYALVRLGSYDQLAATVLDGNGRAISRWWPVAYALQRVQDPRASAALLALVPGTGQATTRAFAVRGLGLLKERKAVDLLLPMIAADREPMSVRVQAIRALAAIGDARAAAPLVKLLSAPNVSPNLRLEAVAALGPLNAGNRVNLFLDLVSERSPAMRSAAFAALARADGDQFVAALSGLDPDPHWAVRAAIATAMGTLPAERAAPLLEPMLKDSDQRVVPAVLGAMVAAKVPNAGAALLERLKADDFVIRQAAATGLGVIKPEGAAQALDAAFNDERDSTYVARAAMLAALVEVDKDAARRVLERALDDREWAVRVRAAQLLRTLDPGSNAVPKRPAPPSPVALASVEALIEPPFSPMAYIDTERGMIQVQLAVLDAPHTVASFIELTRRGFFNGAAVHRVVPDFVMQDGDPRGDGEGGPGYTIRDEINDRPYLRGVIGMALDWEDTGGSQFFITHSPQPHLDGRYTVFGEVVQGMDVVDRIARWDVVRTVRVWDGKAWIGQ
jgi:cyclophilin family peptidyl-prolyl cis-trans isomerase/HEAT repeat protein